MRAAILIAVVAATGCHYHRDTNAPGIVELERPPAVPRAPDENSARRGYPDRPAMEYPGDPGERMMAISVGGLAGGGGRIEDGGLIDLAAEVSLSWGESDVSHNDHASRLFIPRGLMIPQRSDAITLGWSALQILPGGTGEDTDVELGPIYLEAQRARGWWGVAAGWAFDPTNADHGPQLNGFLAVNYLRMRYLLEGGFEVTVGYQLKIPTTWVWSR